MKKRIKSDKRIEENGNHSREGGRTVGSGRVATIVE